MVTLITTLASLTSRTSMGIIVVGGVVRNSTFFFFLETVFFGVIKIEIFAKLPARSGKERYIYFCFQVQSDCYTQTHTYICSFFQILL